MVGEFDLSAGCVVNRDPRVLIHGRDILTVSQSRYLRRMVVQRPNNQGVRWLALLFPSGRVGARINGHPFYSRLLLVSRFGCPYAVVSVGQFNLEALRVGRCQFVICAFSCLINWYFLFFFSYRFDHAS